MTEEPMNTKEWWEGGVGWGGGGIGAKLVDGMEFKFSFS